MDSRSGKMQKMRSELRAGLFESQGGRVSVPESRLGGGRVSEPEIERSLSGHARHQELLFGEKYDLEEDRELGQGCHSIVKLATLKNADWSNPQRFAVKLCRSGDPEIVNTSIETFKNQMILDHPYIVRALELYIDENTETHYLVMEHCPYPSIEDLVISRGIRLEERTVKAILSSCLKAIQHMHDRGVAHRDLKPDNILVQFPPPRFGDREHPLKIIDFGVSAKFKLVDQSSKFFSLKTRDMWTRTGTHFYCAPEIFSGGGYDQKVDIWAMGVTLFQLLGGGTLPFQCETIVDTIEAIEKEEIDFDTPEWSQTSKLGKDLVRRMLQKDPSQRISAKECLLHPWFYKSLHQEQKKCIKSSVDIDHLPIEVDYEKNQHYKCNTLKEYSVDKPSQKSVGSLKFAEGLQQVDSPFARKCKEVDQKPKVEEEKKTSQMMANKKIVWESIQIGSSMQDNEDTFSPLIKLTKMEQTIKKSMHIKKKQMRPLFLPDFRKRYTMIQHRSSEAEEGEDVRPSQRRKTLSLMNTKESFDQHF